MIYSDPLSTLIVLSLCVEVAVLLVCAPMLWRSEATRLGVRIDGFVSRLSRRRDSYLSVPLCVSFLLCALLALLHPVAPRVHDEFSYLLASETFGSGRLANPQHPLWQHFESEHIIQRPTYASKYPPGQGLVLAAALVLTGSSLPGVWATTALLAGLVGWMLRGYLPQRWALLAGLITALHAPLLLWWGNSYWGGAVPAIGGALLYGVLPRIISRPTVLRGVLLGAGCGVMALTRPLEGTLASLPAAAILVWALIRGADRPRPMTSLTRTVIPAAGVLACAGSFMLLVNLRVTGDPLRMPYQVHAEQYSAAPIFWTAHAPAEPLYRHIQLRRFHVGYELEIYQQYRRVDRVLELTGEKLAIFWSFYLGPALSAAALTGLVLRCRIRRRDGRRCPRTKVPSALHQWPFVTAGLALLATLAVSSLGVWFLPHYVAPVFGPIMLLAIGGWRAGLSRDGRRLPSRFVPVVLLARAASVLAVLLAAGPVHDAEDPWAGDRASIVDQLTSLPGEHIVLVRPGGQFRPHVEWVYNAADIDGSRVIWAREMGPAGAARLREYYPDRTFWLLEAYLPEGHRFGPFPVSELRPE